MTDTGRRMGLRVRLVVANSAVVFVLGFFIVAAVGRVYTDHWLTELRRSRVRLAEHCSEDVIDHILTGDSLLLRAEIADHTEALPEEVYIIVLDETGRILAHSFDGGLPRDLADLCRETPGRPSTAEVILEGERVFDVGVPVLDGSIGTVHIGFAEEELHREARTFMMHVAVAALGALVLQMLVSVLLVVRITRPIVNLRSLAEQVRRIGRGMMTVPVQMEGKDEVAEVASAYNTMREEVLEYEKRLRSLASQLSVAEERQRREIASQIHDHIGQVMVAITMKLGALSRQAADAQMAADIQELRGLVEEVVRETRALIFEIAPPVLTELGLVAALEWLCAQMKERYDVTVRFSESVGHVDLGSDMRALLFQASQELLLNVVKHAKAEKVSMSVDMTDNRFSIEIRDDGVGFDARSVMSRGGAREGFGLFSIHERLSFFQGELVLESSPGRGTTATIAVPTAAGG